VFRLIVTMKQGTAASIPAAWISYPTIESARQSSSTVLRDDRVLRLAIVRNEVPPAFVEWAER
jgi:hypothetical protein